MRYGRLVGQLQSGRGRREATTSFSAVELASELHPDLVVLDLGLPDTVGKDTF
jgi:DNA-binding response OmpR family regulator